MQAVWKFPLSAADTQVIKMPASAKLMSIQYQAGKPCLWALVDPDQPEVGHRLILCVSTGFVIANLDLSKFIATVQEGPFVWHFFDGGWK